MQRSCTNCGYNFEKEVKFCPECGTKVLPLGFNEEKLQTVTTSIIVCNNCGEENQLKNKFCDGCGVKLVGNKKEVIVSKSKPADKTNLKKIKQKNTKTKNLNTPKDKKTTKDFDLKKMILIVSAVGIIALVVLITTGVFDQPDTTTNNLPDNTNSGIDLNRISEINALEQIVANNPTDATALLSLANLQQDAGLYQNAITNYKKYLAIEPTNPDARIDMGVCYFSLSDYNSAIKEMEEALKHKPDHQIGYLNLGVVNLNAGNLEISKEWLRKTVEINPNSDAGKRAQSLLDSH